MHFQLRTKLMIIPLLTIVAFMTAVITATVWLSRTVWDQELERSSRSQQEIVLSNIESLKHQALTVAALAADIPGVQEAYELAGQGLETEARACLRQSFDPIHQTVTRILNMDQFQIHFHLPPAKSLLRIWRKPGQKDGGDDLSSFRQTVLEVNRSQKPVTGIEVGRGGFVIRGLAPVQDRSGRHVGSVESMALFEDVCRQSRLNESDQVAVYINGDQLDIADSIRDNKPPMVGGFAAVYATNDQLVAGLVRGDLLERASRERADTVAAGYQITAFPIQDFTGRSVGVMVFVRDVRGLINRMRTMTYIMIGGGAFLVLFIGGFFYRSSSSILQTILKTVDFAKKFSQGDLSKRIEWSRRDELGRLADTLNEMADNLQNQENDLNQNLGNLESVMQKVSAVSDQVATGSRQVSDSSQALSQGAAEQAASLEQISGAMTTIAAQTRTNAQNAGQADRITGESRQAAEKGAKDMQNMITAMTDIDHSSREIAKVLKVIEEIAFQTNLLALNAAVEAARAGKDGKGFAVVAQEVRSLALRSANAAKETENLVNNAVHSAAAGMDLMQTTSESLRNIVEGIVQVSELVGKIAQASNEQASGVTQINQGLTQVEQVTQQNTANAEQTAAAAEDLSGQAGQLHQLLIRFNGHRRES